MSANTERKCSKCRRKLSEHPGKNGPTCTNPPLDADHADHTGNLEASNVNVQKEVYHTPNTTVAETFSFVSAGGTASVASPTPTTAPTLRPTGTVAISTAAATGAAQVPASTSSIPGAVQTTNAPLVPRPAQVTVPTVSTMVSTIVPAATGVPVPAHNQVGQMSILTPQQYCGMSYTLAPRQQCMPIWSSSTTPSTRVVNPAPGPAVPVSQGPGMVDINYLSQQLSLLQTQMASLQSMQPQPRFNQPAANATLSNSTHISPAQAGLAGQASNYQPIFTDQAHANIGAQANQPQHVFIAAAPPMHGAAHPGLQGAQGVPGLASMDVLGDYRNYITTPYISERTARLALTGMFISLDDFLVPRACNIDDIDEMQPVMDPDTGVISYKRKRNVRKINSFYTWLEAYMAYVKMMVKAHGLRAYFDMIDYVTFIQDNDKMYCWPAIYDFDIKHRQRLSGKSIDMMSVDTVLMASVLNSAVIKHAKCPHCKSTDHPPGECPYPPQPPSGNARHRSRSRGKQQTEYCIKFNTSTCTFNGCKRIHKCLKCRGDMPYKECINIGPCKATTA